MSMFVTCLLSCIVSCLFIHVSLRLFVCIGDLRRLFDRYASVNLSPTSPTARLLNTLAVRALARDCSLLDNRLTHAGFDLAVAAACSMLYSLRHVI